MVKGRKPAQGRSSNSKQPAAASARVNFATVAWALLAVLIAAVLKQGLPTRDVTRTYGPAPSTPLSKSDSGASRRPLSVSSTASSRGKLTAPGVRSLGSADFTQAVSALDTMSIYQVAHACSCTY